ncbi:hypothetical protein NAEGRDRAFT_57673 [Naegleria gruberi]|uniref:Uncharacterized protein n=1 Tax=Naegleria gruberi TaxID=5762 RepID=D2VB59_NAEGR|nr:uncharacterized protein NAEGRDRAFT_57673 [Naegleria gruberi]EFC45739.1 hypothetical protein NAEGRDRAFT_57673 [Naegleria gruberi]|eukprot:XP_002678483.1 hypothetical protein NAEGRDRAFT_57673 [Naegleria gruberi strain NEG-M]
MLAANYQNNNSKLNISKASFSSCEPNKEEVSSMLEQQQQQQQSLNDSLGVLLFHSSSSTAPPPHTNNNSSSPSTPTRRQPSARKQQQITEYEDDIVFGKALEVLDLKQGVNKSIVSSASGSVHSPFSVVQQQQQNKECFGVNTSSQLNGGGDPSRRAEFNSPLPSLSPKPFTKLTSQLSSSSSNSSSSNGSEETLSSNSNEDGNCLYGSPKKPKTPTKKTFATYDGYLTSQSFNSCNSSMNSISTGGSRIYDPSTSPSIVERRRSRTLASCDAYQKTIDDYLHIQCIENYIPTITNNSTKCIQVTLKIDSYIKGFESEVLTDCHPLEHECVSPTLSKTKKKEKPQFASVVVYKKNCKNKKHLETMFKTMILPPNSTINLTPNSCQDTMSLTDDCHSPDCVKNVKKHYSYEIISKGFVKGNSSPSQSDLFIPSPSSNTYEQADGMMTSSSSESSSTSSPTQSFFGSSHSLNRNLSVNEETRQCTTPPPDSFVLIRDQEFLHMIGEEFVGFSCFTYAAKKRRIDILKMLCKAQPSKVYENILLDIEQLEKIIELKDNDVIKILITALQFHIENERNQNLKLEEEGQKKKKPSLSILLKRPHHHHEDDGIETEAFIRKYVARNFIFIDNLNAVKVILEMNLVTVQMAAKIAATMSKVNTLRFLLSREYIKPCDYFEGGNVLHWSVLNRASDVIQLVCGMRATKKGHRVNVKRGSSSRLQPFNGMTAFEIAKTVYDQNKLSDEEKLIYEHLQPTKAELIKGVVEIVVHKVIH